MATRLLSFGAEQARRGAYARSDRGLQTIPLARIVGSVGRASELDRVFRRRRRFWESEPRGALQRTARVRQLFAGGHVPAIAVYQIDDGYFVVDGHHRVRVALELAQEFLDAHVIEYLPDRADPANVVYYERLAFVTATGLRDVHVSEPGRYPRLLNRVRDHRHELLRAGASRGIVPVGAALAFPAAPAAPGLDLRAAARDWLEREYLPVLEVLAAERITAEFASRLPGDIFGYVCDHRWYLSERRGWDVGIDTALVDFVARHTPEPIAEALVDPIVALGSEVLDATESTPLAWLRRGAEHPWAALGAGLVALPIAFVRGLRPRHYRFPRRTLAVPIVDA